MTAMTRFIRSPYYAAPARILDQDEGNDTDPQRGVGIREALAPDEAKIKPPPLYRVILLNDDYTPMEFVVDILRKFFGMNTETATRVMLKVHTEGKGVCGVFPKEIAETKATQVNEHARAAEHPLMCDIEIDD
ncbi:MAG TPA: ATP-dependent Clp protease adapter ClpS [Candidatus Acidoferrum sp.]|nr:ATP-dependent Clp protease adapter ClpS [Candidatus Acidoferrum sp.]